MESGSASYQPLQARHVYEKLRTEGYIEPSDLPPAFHADDENWQTTMKGNTLAHATARKPIARRTADRLVEEFLKRVKEINACDDYVYRIKQVIVFGSYLSDKATLGDVDLAVSLEFRYDDLHMRERQCQERIDYALRREKNFRTFLEQVTWPYLEVFTILKGRSPSLSLHDVQVEQILSQPIPSKVLFDASLDKS